MIQRVLAATTSPTPAPAPSTTDDSTWESFWHWFVGTPVTILGILIVAIVVRLIVHRLINDTVTRMSAVAAVNHERPAESRNRLTGSSLGELIPAERRRQRATAVGSLLKSITTAVVFTIALTMVLSEMGINLGPIVASAGIAGVALGFGAQTLVRDFLSGVMMILEDQYGVGDVIDTGFVTGTVEDVGMRVTRVRDLNGVVWYVRNGEVIRIGNRSQGWATATVDLPVAYDEDLENVRVLVDAVGAAMKSDPDWADRLLDAPELMGVEAISGDVVTVRITARTAPQQQMPVSRELRERIKASFDEAGVQVPVVPRGMYPPPAGATGQH